MFRAEREPIYGVTASQKVEANRVVEISLVSEKTYQNPFMEVELDAIVTQPDSAPGLGASA